MNLIKISLGSGISKMTQDIFPAIISKPKSSIQQEVEEFNRIVSLLKKATTYQIQCQMKMRNTKTRSVWKMVQSVYPGKFEWSSKDDAYSLADTVQEQLT